MSLSTLLILSLLSLLQTASCENPTRITTADKLIEFSNSVYSGTNYSGTTVYLDSDIDFTSESSQKFGQIGKYSSIPFLGTFDGQGYSIKSLFLNSSKYQSVGLFGCSTGLIIRNVVIDSSCSIVNHYITSSYTPLFGSFIGKCTSTKGPCTIENSVNMGSITFLGNATKSIYTGGIAGYFYLASYPSAIKNCANYGPVTFSGAGSSWTEIGGIVSTISGVSSATAILQNCLNYGDIVHNGTSKYLSLGGIASTSYYSSIDNCVSAGAISSNKASIYIGAISGELYSNTVVSHCYWSRNIKYRANGRMALPTLSSNNHIFDPATFVLDDSVSVGSYAGNSLVHVLNAAAESHPLRNYSHWLLNKGNHAVSFMVGGTKTSVTMNSQIVLLPSPVKGGNNVFDGWYTEPACTSPLKDYISESDLSLYGKFKEDTSSHTITFNTRGGSSVDPIVQKYGDVVALPREVTRDGCKFLGWEDLYGDSVPSEFPVPAQDVTLYAAWLCDHILTPWDLISFSRAVNEGANYSGTTVFLDSDIDFSGGYSNMFVQIGYDGVNYFNGTFDGQGHVIRNLAMRSSSRYTGLFGYSYGLTIRNVVIDESCSFVSSLSSDSYQGYVAGVVGSCTPTKGPCTIEGVVNMGSVSFNGNVAENLFIGVIVGSLSSKTYHNVIRNCANYGSVTHSGIGGEWAEMGGIIGLVQGSSTAPNSRVQNCLNYGNIVHNGTSKYLILGGIVGISYYSSIDNCVSAGLLTTNQENVYNGAIVGYIKENTEITRCYWNKNIKYNIAKCDPTLIKSSNNHIFDPATFVLDDSVSVGSYAGNSLVHALNAAAESHPLRNYSHWLLNKGNHAVSFTVDGAKTSATMNSQIVLLPSPVKGGRNVFDGWYTESTCTSPLKDYVSESDLSLYGKFKEDTSSHTITFNTRGGSSVNSIAQKYGDVVALPREVTRDGCKFLGWEDLYGDSVPSEFPVPAQDVTLYAAWLCDHISTPWDLISFSKAVNGGANYSGTTVFLDSDIDFSGGYSNVFVQIGYDGVNYFNGTFDGQGHVIRNLDLKFLLLQNTGLFGYSFGLTIRNVVIGESCSFVSSFSSNSYQGSAASVIGTCLSVKAPCSIEGVVNMGSVSFNGNVAENLFIGAIAGEVYSMAYSSTIKNCANYGSVTHSGVGGIWTEMGGIIGLSRGLLSFLANNNIQNCLNYGDIVHIGASKYPALGGIVGISYYSFIDNCVSSGLLTTNQESIYSGAIVGKIEKYSEIMHCYWTNTVRVFDVYGHNESDVLVADSLLASLNKGMLDKLNEREETKNGTWSKWMMLNLNGGKINDIASDILIVTQNQFPEPVKEESVFMFWCKDADCTVKFNPKTDSVTDLYAGWAANRYTVTFDLNNGTVINKSFGFNALIEYPENVEKDGYTLTWDNDVVYMPANNLTITAHWTVNRYTVTFDLNNGTVINKSFRFNASIEYPENVKKDGYTLTWDNDVVYMPAKNLTITAHWTVSRYTVTFDLNNGTVIHKSFRFNASIEYPKNIEKDGYTLTWDNDVVYMPANNLTITATWKKVIVSKSVEVVLSKEVKNAKDVEEIFKSFTNETFTIEATEYDAITGETKVTIKFSDAKKAEKFVENVNGSKDSNSFIKSASTIAEGDTSYSFCIDVASTFYLFIYLLLIYCL